LKHSRRDQKEDKLGPNRRGDPIAPNKGPEKAKGNRIIHQQNRVGNYFSYPKKFEEKKNSKPKRE